MGLFDDREDIVRGQDFVFLVVEFDFRAAVFADEDAVAFFDFKRKFLSVVVGLAGAEGDNNAFGGFLLGGIGDDNAPFFNSLLSGGFDKNPVAEGSYV